MPERTLLKDRPVILLTGASGVLGRALVDELSDDFHLVCPRHRTPLADPRVEEIPGADLLREDLGLAPARRRSLRKQVDLVLHCAAQTNWSLPRERIREANVDGTEHLLDFAASADAAFHHVSTAFVARHPGSTAAAGSGVAAYIESKVASEELVRGSGLPGTIVRPSVIIGDSRTGRIARYQGLHKVIGAIMQGTVPLIPAGPGSLVDCVPQDIVARAVGVVMRRGARSGEFWLTAGAQAPQVVEAVDASLEAAARAGLRPVAPRQLPIEAVNRLLIPMLDGLMDESLRRSLEVFLELLMVFQSDSPLPSSMAELGLAAECGRPLLVQALRRSAQAWTADQLAFPPRTDPTMAGAPS
jgi:nucleoside-diphosphate-sugar epimerase